ncbi:hypothetical protein [Streptomyces sp. NPDC050560]|uniref:hypothetical protein n=1 Tax=Streptomyces sp. NPDC050560 TaxID=3365630 RepID=UPI0037A4C77A
MNARLIDIAANALVAAREQGRQTATGQAIRLEAEAVLAAVRTAALHEGADAVDAMQTARDDEVTDLVGGLPDRVAVEHVTARRTAALLREMAGSPAAEPEPAAAGPICTEAEARAAGLDIAASTDELTAMAETIVAAHGDEPSAEVDLARAVPLMARAIDRLRARVAELEAERYRTLGDDLNPSSLVIDAGAYSRLRDAITATMTDPDAWDDDEAEDAILARYVQWLAARAAGAGESDAR